MGKSRRIQKVEKELRQVVSQYLLTKLRDFSEIIYSVSFVKVTADLRQARVFVAGLNGRPDIDWLQSHAGEIQKEFSRVIRMKYCPKIIFSEDNSTENILKIEKALHEVSQTL